MTALLAFIFGALVGMAALGVACWIVCHFIAKTDFEPMEEEL
jgi:hypothetical protein